VGIQREATERICTNLFIVRKGHNIAKGEQGGLHKWTPRLCTNTLIRNLVLRFARWEYGIGLGACGEGVSCFDGILILPGTAASSDL
jgi:hypothetical protein